MQIKKKEMSILCHLLEIKTSSVWCVQIRSKTPNVPLEEVSWCVYFSEVNNPHI